MIRVWKDYVQNLSNEELVVKYQNTENRMMQDQIAEILLKRVEKIILWVADQYANIPNTDRDDRISELYFTFYKALSRYSPSRGMKFTSFCRNMFESDMRNLYQYKKRQKRYTGAREISLENLLEQGGQTLTLTGSVDTGVEFTATVQIQDYSDIEFASFLDQIGLTEREMTVCGYFITGGTNKSELAKDLHVSSPMITKYIKNIGRKLYTNSGMRSPMR